MLALIIASFAQRAIAFTVSHSIGDLLLSGLAEAARRLPQLQGARSLLYILFLVWLCTGYSIAILGRQAFELSGLGERSVLEWTAGERALQWSREKPASMAVTMTSVDSLCIIATHGRH